MIGPTFSSSVKRIKKLERVKGLTVKEQRFRKKDQK